jgi:uncharacterized iron-regulated membrane protein
MTRQLTVWQQWVKFPRGLWLRRACFQIHLWLGVGVGVYVLLISLSGAMIVYRPQIAKKFARKDIILTPSGPQMSVPDLEQNAQRMYPGYQSVAVFQSRKPNRSVEVVLLRGPKRIVRLFDPFTGKDLGDPLTPEQRTVEWLVDLHDNLLTGDRGRLANGIAAIIVTVLSLAGAVVWWPGIKHWRRSVGITWTPNLVRFNWGLHSALGFWCCLFVLMWGISGIYFSFPGVFRIFGNRFLFWLARLHFGRMGWFPEALWTIVGLIPAILAVTGILMWWNRVLRKHLRQLW